MDALVTQYGYPLIFATMVSVGILGAVPSSKLLYTACGYLIVEGLLDPLLVVVIGALGHTSGNWVQFQLGRWKGELFFNRWMRVNNEQIARFRKAFLQRPLFWLFFGKLVDPVKWLISFIAGTSRTPLGGSSACKVDGEGLELGWSRRGSPVRVPGVR